MSVEEASSLVIRIFGSPQPLRTVCPSEEPDTVRVGLQVAPLVAGDSVSPWGQTWRSLVLMRVAAGSVRP